MRRISLMERLRRFGESAIDAVAVFGRATLFLFHALLGRGGISGGFGLLVKQLHSVGVMSLVIIVVSHDLAETASIADYIYIVGEGQVLGQGTPAELLNSQEPRIRQFMTGEPDGPVAYHFPATDYRADLLGKR